MPTNPLKPATHISLVATPDAVISTLSGIYDILNSLGTVLQQETQSPATGFDVRIVGSEAGPVELASGLPIQAHCGVADIERTDVVIVPSFLVLTECWESGRYPEIVNWLQRVHDRGAVLCSACSGIFLLAETGLYDGVESTVHWSYADKFRRSFPRVPVDPERALVASGAKEDLVSSGASASWHDLVLYLVTRYASPTAAQVTAKFYALQWHREGLAPYVVFHAPKAHDDAVVARAQDWLAQNFAIATPLESVVEISGLAERSFKRRFTQATGYTPINYVQRLRIEDAKRRLERSDASVEDISWQVGYDDAAFFRKLFKRLVSITPAAYRKKFQIPDYARSEV